MRALTLIYGLASYLVFFASFVYAIFWIGNLGVPNALDSQPHSHVWLALGINFALLALFAVQHSLMARPFFKQWIKRFVPESLERSTYVLASSLALIAFFAFWQPIGGTIWHVDNQTVSMALYAIYFCGWALVLVSTFLISHSDLFGVRQVWTYFRGKDYEPLKFRTPGIYKYVRHPLYLGWLIVFWFTPTMTGSHFLFAMGTTAYILLAVRLEERDLEDQHGVVYTQYKNEVPMLIPSFTKLPEGSEAGTSV